MLNLASRLYNYSSPTDTVTYIVWLTALSKTSLLDKKSRKLNIFAYFIHNYLVPSNTYSNYCEGHILMFGYNDYKVNYKYFFDYQQKKDTTR